MIQRRLGENSAGDFHVQEQKQCGWDRRQEIVEDQANAAGNGLEAMECAQRIPYDVIFMDCQMPEMDGFEAAAAIREHERRMHVIVPGEPAEDKP